MIKALPEFETIASLDLDPIKVKLMHNHSGEGWSLARASAVEVEYRRFLFLMKKYPDELAAPTVDVDTFWHYHILDTAKYAADCEAIFGYFLHHFPYLGLRGEEDMQAHDRAGERMRELYEESFGEAYLQAADSIEPGGIEPAFQSGEQMPLAAQATAYSVRAPQSVAAAQTAYSVRSPASTAAGRTAYSVRAPESIVGSQTAYSVRAPESIAGSHTAYSVRAPESIVGSQIAYSVRVSASAPANRTAYSVRAPWTPGTGIPEAVLKGEMDETTDDERPQGLDAFFAHRPKIEQDRTIGNARH
jgi:hypothetical protein